jgi:hypothetical protein
MSLEGLYRVDSSVVQFETEDVSGRFLYNPETQYLLLPADVYASLSGDELQDLKSEPLIEGIYNHQNISAVR